MFGPFDEYYTLRSPLSSLQNRFDPKKSNSADYAARRLFAEVMLQKERKEIPLSHLFMSDEANFHLDDGVNKQNCRCWSDCSPRLITELPPHSPRVTVFVRDEALLSQKKRTTPAGTTALI